ncbi:MAG: hypothetical protein V2B13_00965 [Pseudomonadota bacterium]
MRLENKRKIRLGLIRKQIGNEKMVSCFRTSVPFSVMPARMALYAFFAMIKKDCTLSAQSCSRCMECFLSQEEIYKNQDKILDLYARLAGSRPLGKMSDSGIVNLSGDNFTMYKSKIRQDLQKSFPLYDQKDLEIASIGKKPNTRYGIGMDKGRIEIVY